MVLHRPVELAALTGKVGYSTNFTGKATYQDLAGWSEDNFRVADNPSGIALVSAGSPQTVDRRAFRGDN